MKDTLNYNRQSIRLKEYDYSQNGLYFITICTLDRKKLLSEIINLKCILNDFGIIVENELLRTSKLYNYINIYDYIIMPNHIHCIIKIDNVIWAQSCAPTGCKPIGSIIRGFKSSVSSIIGFSIWQRNYYEHIIRNEKELYQIQEYIQYNPLNWMSDKNNLDFKCIK